MSGKPPDPLVHRALRTALVSEISAWIKRKGLPLKTLAYVLGFQSGQEVSRMISPGPSGRVSLDRIVEAWYRIGGEIRFEVTLPAQDSADAREADRQNLS